jgi:hypothetical protein
MQSSSLVPTAGPSGRVAIPRPRRPAGAVPLGLLGMIVLVYAIEGTIARRDDLTNAYAANWKHTGSMLHRKEVTDSSILCFGTSLTKMGVSARVMQEALQEPVYNLALNAAQPFACYSTLRQTLEAGARPRAIVVDFMWIALAREYTFNERLIPELATLGDCIGFAGTTRDSSFLGRLVLAKLLPSYRGRLEIRDNITAAVRGERPNRFVDQWVQVINAKSNRGSIHLDKKIDYPEMLLDPADFDQDWNCPPSSEIYIEKFLALAASHNIRVFWLVPPMSPVIQNHLNGTGIQARFDRLVESIQARHPDLGVLDFSRSNYPWAAFFDVKHLNRDGAVALSRDLAVALKSQLNSPASSSSTWVRFPDYQPDPEASRIEDLLVTYGKIRQTLEWMSR